MQREYQPKWLKMFRKISRAKLRRKKTGARILHVTSTDIVGVEISITQVFFFACSLVEKDDSLLSGSRETVPLSLNTQILNDGPNADKNTKCHD